VKMYEKSKIIVADTKIKLKKYRDRFNNKIDSTD
jgi:hypothetical protein